MCIAIFTDTYAPEINGVARTLGRLTEYLERRNIAYQVFAPETKNFVPLVPQVKRFTSMPFLLYPECRLALPNPIDLNQTLQHFNPTLIHIATPFNLGLFGLNYGKKHHIPMVASSILILMIILATTCNFYRNGSGIICAGSTAL